MTRTQTKYILTGVVIVVAVGLVSAAAGRSYERTVADRILENLEHGQPVWLRANNHEFLALYKPVFGARPRRAVVLTHGMGAHPDWPEVIQPLRTRLPEHGWSTLSLQMPVLAGDERADDYGATVPEAVQRIRTGVDYLRERDYASVIIIGYGFGAASALSYQAEHAGADGLIAVGVLAHDFLQPQIDLAALIGRVKLPLLDVYGGRDFPEIVRKAQDRRQAARGAGNAEFKQAVVEGADHYFSGQEQTLVRIVADWLDRLPAKLEARERLDRADNP